jgi:hypothetical protein
MAPEYKRPQWVESRIKSLKKKPDCGGTHSACKCFIEKIMRLEAELVSLKHVYAHCAHDYETLRRPCTKSPCQFCMRGFVNDA